MPFDERGSDVMDEEECRTLLELAGASEQVGRLAINRESSPYVIPVDFSYFDEEILIRLGPGFAAHHLNGTTAAFEIDHSEPYSKSGWSVTLEGPARVMTYEEVARLGRNAPRPIVMSPGMRVFAIRPERISGRTIRHDHENASPRPSSSWPDRYHENPAPSTSGTVVLADADPTFSEDHLNGKA